jgi:hypothetical protein
VQPPRHLHGQPALARQDIRGSLARADQAAEIGLRESTGRHAIADRLDRIRRIDDRAVSGAHEIVDVEHDGGSFRGFPRIGASPQRSQQDR